MCADSVQRFPSSLGRATHLGVALQFGAWLVLSAAAPERLAAQAKVELTPFAGLYWPASNLIDESGSKVEQETIVMFGGRVGVWVTDRVAVEGSFGYAPSKLKFSSGSLSADTTAHVLLANGRVLIGLGPTGRNSSWHAILGGGLVSHGGAGWNAFEQAAGENINGKTKVSGVVGVGGTFKVGSTMGVRVDVEDNMFSAKFKGATSGSETQSKFNNDVVVTIGLSFRFSGSK